MQYFGVGDCDVAGENTLFPEDKDDQNICFMSTVVASGKCSTSGKGSETTFPECQYGIFVPSQLIFNTSLQASTADYTYTKKGSTQTYSFESGLSPWGFMANYKDSFYYNSSSTTTMDIDVFVHAALTCPKLAHGTWGTFITPYKSTNAATGITGEYGANGCYGKTCEGCPDDSNNGDTSYTDSSGCCSVSLASADSDATAMPNFTESGSFTSDMGTSYYNLLQMIDACNITDPDSCPTSTSPWVAGSDGLDSMDSDYSPSGTFPDWIFSNGCLGDGCDSFSTPSPTPSPTYSCASWCSSNSNSWDTKCNWAKCENCDDCDSLLVQKTDSWAEHGTEVTELEDTKAAAKTQQDDSWQELVH